MATTITVGTVQSSSSATAGTIKTLAGTTISYSDSTLSTRSIALTLGEYVIFAYDDVGLTTVGITPLTDIYADGLTDANADNDITAAGIRRSLQINNACASYKGAQWIEKQEQKVPCSELKDQAELMVAMIDAVTDFTPEDELISGRQATYMVTYTSVGNQALAQTTTLTVGTATYTASISTNPRTTTQVATNLAAAINALYPQNYPYYAEASGANVIISGSDFSTSNGTAVSISVTNGAVAAQLPNTLANGSASVAQGANGITNQQVKTIIDKLNRLCSTPCLDVVNFENEP